MNDNVLAVAIRPEPTNLFRSLRSAYGIKGQGRNRQGYIAQVVNYAQPINKNNLTIYRPLHHKPFKTATEALQFATRLRNRLAKMVHLGQCDEALCLCKHPAQYHVHTDIANRAQCCAEQCECARFVWVWSKEAHERAMNGLGVVTLGERIAD